MKHRLTFPLLLTLLAACAPVKEPAQTAMDKEAMESAMKMRKSGQAANAVKLLTEVHARSPQDKAVLGQLGYALIEDGKAESAVSVFDKLIALDGKNAMAYNGKGVAFDNAGNHLAAQDLYQRALSLSPDNLVIQNNMAMSFILNDQLDQAIALLEKLRLQHNENKTVRQNLALAYALKGDKKKAEAINLQSLSPAETKENMRFYEEYAKKRKKMKEASGSSSPSQVGFMETPGEPQAKPAEAGNTLPTAEAAPAHFPSQKKR